MPRKSAFSILTIFRIALLTISVFGLWYLYNEWIDRKRAKQRLMTLKQQLIEASLHINDNLCFDKYFSFTNEQRYQQKFKGLRKEIPTRFQHLGLETQLETIIMRFVETFDNISMIRKKYNDEFVKKEKISFSYLLASLEDYPLSQDQMEAIIRDEDNNLVVAGAGTGKTTTIAGKVAYILEKRLANPEELLIISFTKNAVNEMYERCLKFCKDVPKIEKLEVRTFNSFGNLVKRHCSHDEILLAFKGDDETAKLFLQESFDRLFTTDTDFQKKATNFLAFFNRPDRDEFAFETQSDFINHERSFKNETLDGVKVKSKEEMQLGNFFCLFGINYEYEKHYPLKLEDRDPNFGAYCPDFFLTDYNIWHEHFGIDRKGNVPSRFRPRPPFHTAKEYYHAGIIWKRSIHDKYQTKLIETYSFENSDGKLISSLKKKLIDENVIFNQRTPEELLPIIKKSVHFDDFIKLIHTFLSLMKSNGKLPEDIKAKKDDLRSGVFLDVFKLIYNEYKLHLNRMSQIDYNDMINHATHHLMNGDFTKPYKYILVDEFQDTSLGRYALLKSIKKQNPDAKLYAVGDDWQSIFRFTGSDISIITDFEKHFGFTSKTSILKTYRFNDEILKVSSDFIKKNPAQIDKKLFSDRPATSNSFEFISLTGVGNKDAYQNEKESIIRTTLDEITRFKSDASVYLIGRYNHNSPDKLRALIRDYPNLKIEYYTAHGVKGMTCDYAILLDIDSGILGFPSEVADDPLLNYLLHEGDKFENAEERRVFYVAITRARHKNYLLYNYLNPSKFLIEIMSGYDNHMVVMDKCPECNGILVKRKGPYGEFQGCSNFPQCDGKALINVYG